MQTGRGRADDAADCEAILRSLPEWFGIEESILEYRRDLEAMETFLAVTAAGAAGKTPKEGARPLEGTVGFITLNQHNASTAEIHVMGVRKEIHGSGAGRALIDHVESICRARNVEFMEVKTLGPSRPDANYERTRGFYTHLGFRPLEENQLWGEANPCLIMVKHLRCHASDPHA